VLSELTDEGVEKRGVEAPGAADDDELGIGEGDRCGEYATDGTSQRPQCGGALRCADLGAEGVDVDRG
jgi:hypothetical protein